MKPILLLCILLVFLILIFTSHEYYTDYDPFPKIIWTYWIEEDIPPLVSKCIETWKIHNPTYKINILSRKNINQYISIDITKLPRNDSPARESDFVRLNILSKYGGFWIDASSICRKSFDWIQERSLNKEFFGYYISNFTTDDRYPVIESWFFACKKNSKFVKLWSDEFMKLNNFDSVDDYVNNIKIDTDIQNISSPDYLAIHIAIQRVLQIYGPWNDIELISATDARDGPLYYLQQTDWNSNKAIISLCEQEKEKQTSIIKFRGSERETAENNMNCLF